MADIYTRTSSRRQFGQDKVCLQAHDDNWGLWHVPVIHVESSWTTNQRRFGLDGRLLPLILISGRTEDSVLSQAGNLSIGWLVRIPPFSGELFELSGIHRGRCVGADTLIVHSMWAVVSSIGGGGRGTFSNTISIGEVLTAASVGNHLMLKIWWTLSKLCLKTAHAIAKGFEKKKNLYLRIFKKYSTRQTNPCWLLRQEIKDFENNL